MNAEKDLYDNLKELELTLIEVAHCFFMDEDLNSCVDILWVKNCIHNTVDSIVSITYLLGDDE